MSTKLELPRQLQRQQEELEQLERDMAAAAASKSNDPPADTPPVQTGTEPPAQAPVTAPPPQAGDDQWEQKFRTLKGKYDAEVPRLHQQVRELAAQIQELSKRPTVETPPPQEKPRQKRVTEKDTETFGADLLDVIKRQAEDLAGDALAELNKKVDTLLAENAELKQKVTGVTTSQAQSAQEIYFTKLASAVSDWEAINVSPGFLEWLGVVDELSGHTRQAHLTNAFESLDVARTAKIFNAYKATLAPPSNPQPQPPTRQQEVQRQVAPGKSKTPPNPTASDAATKIWTASEIDEFYRDMRQGHYKTKPQEAARIEAEIDAAVASGRVRA